MFRRIRINSKSARSYPHNTRLDFLPNGYTAIYFKRLTFVQCLIRAPYADPHNTPQESGSHPIQGTANARRSSVGNMGINHRRFHLRVANQLLHGSDACLCVAGRHAVPVFQQVYCKRMPESMTTSGLRNSGFESSHLNRQLQDSFMQCVSHKTKNPLPHKGTLQGQSIGSHNL